MHFINSSLLKSAIVVAALLFSVISIAGDDKKKDSDKKTSYDLSGFKFRCVGPALTSGRIADIAVNPNNSAEYYLAVASGGVWKTSNAGTTYHPIFDKEGSYSIGCITLDPSNSNTVWVGTGENNNQRSVAYGDGLYKSLDGGKTWKNVGLKLSEHIGEIAIHPHNGNIVYVAAYGPLWSAGGDRGIYKTENGGDSWTKVLEVDENTGFNEIKMDPKNPDILYACAHQRRRHVYTYVGGGQGSGIYKSEDAGKTWRKINKSLPSKMGRIGLAVSPVDGNYLYAIVEAEDNKGGFYRSTDKGESWERRSAHVTSGNYYQELVCDLTNKDKVFSMDTWLQHTIDGGKTFVHTGEKSKHVDNHCMWIDPKQSDHWIVGCDGGVYETWDHADNWNFKPNLPVIQFYKVAVDYAKPFYNIYGGTQDNNSLGGPSQTINNHGIMNSDWVITNGGDGFESAVDPTNPNIVYAQSQYGWLVRYDKKSGESVGIKPSERVGEPALRWNWDAPLLISPHNPKRLYFAANVLFKSENRGDDWKQISPDLTRKLDRNTFPVMGRVQSVDAVMKNMSTTVYGNIVALDESPIMAGLLYVGTDDGLIQVSEDDGVTWRKIEQISGVPAHTYVNAITASAHDVNVVYAVFNNHKNGDFKPYICKSTDKGKSWQLVTTNLPERGSVYDLVEDHKSKDLLFAGTEFGVFTSFDGGNDWHQLKGGLPTIAVRDIEIQKDEDDLVLATFGRGFYVLDDYSPLRNYTKVKDKKIHIFPVKNGLMYIDARPLGLRGKGSQGESLYTAENPPIGAVFTFVFNDSLSTLKEIRQKKENDLIKANKDVHYPSLEMLRNEDNEEKPYLLACIYDEQDKEIRRMRIAGNKGINRFVWDFRYNAEVPIVLKENKPGRYGEETEGALALPGKYSIQIFKVNNGEVALLSQKINFNCEWLENTELPVLDKNAMLMFHQNVDKLRKAVYGTSKVVADLKLRNQYLHKAIETTPGVDLNLLAKTKLIENKILGIEMVMYGDKTAASREFETNENISGRVGRIIWNVWRARTSPSELNKTLYEDCKKQFTPLVAEINELILLMTAVEKELDNKFVPYTPGRLPLIDFKLD